MTTIYLKVNCQTIFLFVFNKKSELDERQINAFKESLPRLWIKVGDPDNFLIDRINSRSLESILMSKSQ